MMKQRTILNIASQFSTSPAGRYRTDGIESGQVFREDLLAPALKEAEIVEVNLDGTDGYGSSFLEETFGGLLRSRDLALGQFAARVHLIANDDPSLLDEILGYVADEERRQSGRN